MKYLILSIALLLTIASCEKEERDPETQSSDTVVVPVNFIEPDTAYTKE